MGYSSSIWPKWFPWPSSSWSGESEGSGGGGEWARARDWPGEPIDAFGSRSTTREMVGEVPVRSATAWSCLASVMSTPLIWIDNKTNHGRCQPIITGNTSIQSGTHFKKHAKRGMWPSLFSSWFHISSLEKNRRFWNPIQSGFVSAPKWVLLFDKEPNTSWSKKNKKREKGAEGKRRMWQIFSTWQSFLEGYMQAKPFFKKLVSHRIRQIGLF